MSKREKVLLAVLGSVVAHVLILLLLALAAQLPPAKAAVARAEPLRVQVVDEEPAPDPPELVTSFAQPTPPPYIQTLDRQQSDRPPEDPAFQSDKDTRAASELPATGDAPMPSQEGRKSPVFAFDTQVYTPGDRPAVAAKPVDTTPPRPQVDRDAPRPTPPPAPEPTPQPTAAPDEFAMLAPQPTPKPWKKRDDTTPFDPFARENPAPPPQPLAPGSTRPVVPGFQPQTARNQISGNITNRGPSAVAAQGTPLGKYQKAISDAVASRWYMYVQQHRDLPLGGVVKVHFVIQRSGRVGSAKVVSQTGGDSLASFSVGAVLDATIPPIPDDVQAIINNTVLELDYNFYVE